MIGIFPTPYPDELLYSICARLSSLLDYSNSQLLIKDIYGARCSSATWGIPGHLAFFLNQLPPQNTFSLEQVIRDLTILPYYSGFLSPDCYQQICNDLAGFDARSVFYRSGIMASRIPMPDWLRYCPVCYQSDKAKYGELYWHRLHQLPGIEVCPEHLVLLENSQISMRTGRNHTDFICASHSDTVRDGSHLEPVNQEHQTLLFLARESAWLLNNQIPGSSQTELRNRYLHLLIAKGFATYSGSIKVNYFLECFCKYFPHSFLKRLHCEFSGNDTKKTNWLLRLVRNTLSASHPLYHLLLMRFLGITVREFYCLPAELQFFGDSPWPCLNAAADHYKELTVTEFHYGKRLRKHKPVGIFQCECGFCYSRSGPDQMPEDRYQIGKVISFGRAWETKLRQLWKSKSLTITQIARQLNVDPLTIKRHAVRFGLPFSGDKERLTALRQSDQLRSDKATSEREKRTQCRNTWLTILRETPSISMKALRQRLPQTYQWLTLNDSAWLKKHQPFLLWKPRDNSSVNWGLRDLEMVEAIKDAASNIRQKGPRPKRITKTAIGKELGHTTLLQQKLDKLPLASQLLTSLVETREDFAIRRVEWVANLYSNERVVPQAWQLIQRACIYSLKDNPNIQNAVQNSLFLLESHLTP